MINFTKAQFILSAPKKDGRPNDQLHEVIFIGKSNVGKSSLINALVGRNKLAFTSSKPGYTTLLNYFLIDEKFYLVDAPGYGYSKRGRAHDLMFGEMMEDYFSDNPYLKHVFFLLDSRHVPSVDDLDFYNFIKAHNVSFTLVMTKADKLNQKASAAVLKNVKKRLEELPKNIILVSSETGSNIDLLQKQIAAVI